MKDGDILKSQMVDLGNVVIVTDIVFTEMDEVDKDVAYAIVKLGETTVDLLKEDDALRWRVD